MSAFARELEVALAAAREAAGLIREVRARGFGVIQKPGGGGPVTEADTAANAAILARLSAAFPADGIVAEETADQSGASRARCWWVDPLDGTREFVDGTDQFAIHVGLSVDGGARLGVVLRPADDATWWGVVGEGSFAETPDGPRRLQVSGVVDGAAMRLLTSRSHKSKKTEKIVQALGITSRTEQGSVGLKSALLAEGRHDLYVHPSDRSWRWDSCAPEAILRGAGGVLVDLFGAAYRYDAGELRNFRGLLGASAAALPGLVPVTSEVARAAGWAPRG